MKIRPILINSAIFASIFLLFLTIYLSQSKRNHFYNADDHRYYFTGRFDASEKKVKKAWAPGVCIEFKFKGSFCDLVVEDEGRHFNKNNVLVVVVDGQKPQRIRLNNGHNQLKIAKGLSKGSHKVVICKATESYIGYIKFLGVWCKDLIKYKRNKKVLFEFIGDSMTCGSGADSKPEKPSGDNWTDLENAYVSFGPVLSRRYNARWMLSSVSGIGLMKSFTESDKNMPEMYLKTSLDEFSEDWKFEKQQEPDIVFVTLGQNDGIQKADKFISTYVGFVKFIRSKFPHSRIICCSSPMAQPLLRVHLNKCIPQVVSKLKKGGEKYVYSYCFKGVYNSGHKSHPSKAEHIRIADELQQFLNSKGWATEQSLLEQRIQ
ncbi:MAG: hypothetical protein RIT43_1552 [Bacteroidota bacterium]|jgi:lysophospholipase L1-like esterase